MPSQQNATFVNPLREESRHQKFAAPCVLVIFGSTGDLTARKLVPALYNLAKEGQLPAHFACVGFARRDKNNEVFRSEMRDAISKFSRTKPIDETVWQTFQQQLFYHRSNFDSDEGYENLKNLLNTLDKTYDTRGNRVYYLSTPPKNFAQIIQKLHQHGLIYESNSDNSNTHFSRVIIEKPFGHDLSSSLCLQAEISKYLNEQEIYRIDHYLGKETVQNLLNFRFANPIFEALWNRQNIDHVQITVSEELGIGTRGHFFEEAGILRDIVQNHMMQLLSIVAMEPPINMKANAIRDEKVKVLQAIRPFPTEGWQELIIRGQYGPGFINGESVPGYRQEADVNLESNVESYVAMCLYIDNWRWADVPFYLRAGKRLPKRSTEIAITFKNVPGPIQSLATSSSQNVLVIRIQPDEGISLNINCKVPGLSVALQPVKMDFRYGSFFGAKPPEAYERLICDCMAGDNTLFARIDEVIASWRLFTPILEHWAQQEQKSNFPNYSAGTWGPKCADALLEREGNHWRII